MKKNYIEVYKGADLKSLKYRTKAPTNGWEQEAILTLVDEIEQITGVFTNGRGDQWLECLSGYEDIPLKIRLVECTSLYYASRYGVRVKMTAFGKETEVFTEIASRDFYRLEGMAEKF